MYIRPYGSAHAALVQPVATNDMPSGAAKDAIPALPQSSGLHAARVTVLQLRPPSPLLSRFATPHPCMAQLSWANTLAQVSPAGVAARVTLTAQLSGSTPRAEVSRAGVGARWTLTAVLSRPRLPTHPSLVQRRPPSVLVR